MSDTWSYEVMDLASGIVREVAGVPVDQPLSYEAVGKILRKANAIAKAARNELKKREGGA